MGEIARVAQGIAARCLAGSARIRSKSAVSAARGPAGTAAAATPRNRTPSAGQSSSRTRWIGGSTPPATAVAPMP
jgi:hypothetical protein